MPRIDTAALRPAECPNLRRLGNAHDGGYVVPLVALERASVLLSFGLSMDWTFERAALALNPRLTLHAYDHTVGPRLFAKAAVRDTLALSIRALTLRPRRINKTFRKVRRSLDYFRFFRGRARHFPQRVWFNDDRNSADIRTIIARTGVTEPHSIFAKIDIEGSEYRILPFIAERAHLFSGLVIEFHDTDVCAPVFNAQVALLRRDFEIVHTHANNAGDLNVDRTLPLSWELSLLHKDLYEGPARPYLGPLPRPGLDAPNDPSRPDYVLSL
ncbi:MAG TPA: hypothetical protein VIN61_17260 [Gammaproteobacteria bacterium]